LPDGGGGGGGGDGGSGEWFGVGEFEIVALHSLPLVSALAVGLPVEVW
jgi:hypothetical protein